MPMRAYNRCTLEAGCWSGVVSEEAMSLAQSQLKSESIEDHSALLGSAQNVNRVLELAVYRSCGGDGQDSQWMAIGRGISGGDRVRVVGISRPRQPTPVGLAKIKFTADWTVFLIIIWRSSISRLRSE